MKLLESAAWSVRAKCRQHNYLCRLDKKADISIFGAPCTDDSSMGSMLQDDGAARLDSGFELKLCFFLPVPSHRSSGLVPDYALRNFQNCNESIYGE